MDKSRLTLTHLIETKTKLKKKSVLKITLKILHNNIQPPISHHATTGISFLILKQYSSCLSKQSFFLLPGIRNRPFATRILSFTAMADSTTCGRHLVFARLILKNSLFKRCASVRTWAVQEIYP